MKITMINEDNHIVDIILDNNEYSIVDGCYSCNYQKMLEIAKLYAGKDYEFSWDVEAIEHEEDQLLLSFYFDKKVK